MSNQTLFDTEKAQVAKEEGMHWSAMSNAYRLRTAKFAAVHLGICRGEVTADDVAKHLQDMGESYGGPWTGSIFKGKCWEFTGRWVKSRRVSNHGRMIRVWRYVG